MIRVSSQIDSNFISVVGNLLIHFELTFHFCVPDLLDPIGHQIPFISAKQSSTYTTYTYGSELKLTADKAIDGNTHGSAGDFTHTIHNTEDGNTNPWWEGQLERLAIITKISVYNRRTGSSSDPGYSDRIKGFYLQIYRDDEEEKVFQFQDPSDESDTVEDRYDIYPNIAGSKVKIGLSGSGKILQLSEVEVFGYTLQE